MSKIFKRKIVIIFLSIRLNMCFGCSKTGLIETVLWVPTTYVLVDKQEK